MMRLVVDLEADGLLYEATQIWCIVAYDIDTNYYYLYTSEPMCIYPEMASYSVTLQEMLDLMESADELILHNGLGYDLPLLERLHGFNAYKAIGRVFDTFVGSCLFFPDRQGGHSLKSWGINLGLHKGDYDDWSKYTDEMLEYCIRDVDVTRRIYDELIREMSS